MDFLLSEEHRTIQQSIGKFCRAKLDPIAARIERKGCSPKEIYHKLGRRVSWALWCLKHKAEAVRI